MRKLVGYCILSLIRFSLWFRYRVTYKGVKNLNSTTLNKPGGVLFIPNHPTVFVDPSLVTIGIYHKFPIRPLIVEYMYYSPGIHWLMKFMNAIPIPNLNTSTNSLKRRRSEYAFQEVIKGLRQGSNFLVYPGGKVKRSNYEHIGGSSGVHAIVQNNPDTNIVMVRVTGLYGSRFSTALTGQVPPIFPNIFQGIKIALKNLLFFSPRRNVIIEYMPAPADFPRHASRLAFNKYLEHWYNRPDGLDPELAKKALPGESLYLVSYSLWGKEFPDVKQRVQDSGAVDLAKIPEQVQRKVVAKLAEMTEVDTTAIKPAMSLSSDLGLDSLDAAEIFIFLQDTFGVTGIPPSELTTVGRLMAIAAKQVTFHVQEDEQEKDLKGWKRPPSHALAKILEGETLPEVFLKRCDTMGNLSAVADLTAGVQSFKALKLRMILLADYIRKLPGENIGIMLPASVAASVVILATQLAGKVPVMINWTVGSRHLESVVELSGIQHVLSSWTFIDRLDNVELDGIEERLILLEDVRRSLGIIRKLKALVRSKMPTRWILKVFGMDKRSGNDRAVILFTSGTESMPKGVPLTHRNLLSCQRGALEALDIYQEDVLYNILPPFHSFGFTVSGLMGILGGLRTAFYPNPTDGPRLANGVGRWSVTVLCGAPTFLRGILKSVTPEQMNTVRICASGAEKIPPELEALLAKFGKADRLAEGYGITECAPILTVSPPGKKRIGVGKPIRGVELLIVHPETNQILPLNEQGLILARGPNIFSGYLNKDIASPFIEIEGKFWYKTGDLGFLDADGNLTISGRLKRFIKIGGEMISLVAIETALVEAAEKKGWELAEDSPSLAVIAQEADGVKARVMLFARFFTTVEEANSALRMVGFSNLVKITDVKHLTEIPIMGTGKINYRELQARYMNHDDSAITV